MDRSSIFGVQVRPGQTLESLSRELLVDGSRLPTDEVDAGDLGPVQLVCDCGPERSIRGQVFDDRNANGQQDDGEIGLNDVRISIDYLGTQVTIATETST